MNCNCNDDHLPFHLMPAQGQNFILSSTLVYDQVPAKLIIFPSSSAVLCVLCLLSNVVMCLRTASQSHLHGCRLLVLFKNISFKAWRQTLYYMLLVEISYVSIFLFVSNRKACESPVPRLVPCSRENGSGS